MNKLKWKWRELQRLHRLWKPEPSAALLIETVGAFWLWRHGARREFRVRLWNTGDGWYCADLAVPEKMLIVEADGGVHKARKTQDVARDYRLTERGWKVLRIKEDTMTKEPAKTRRMVRRFIKKGDVL